MTRAEAIDKIVKLRRLADRNDNPSEASAARARADRLATEHHISLDDLLSTSYVDCYNGLVDELQKMFVEVGLPSQLGGVSSKLKENTTTEKIKALRWIVGLAYSPVIELFSGLVPSIEEFRRVVDRVFKSRNLEPVELLKGTKGKQ